METRGAARPLTELVTLRAGSLARGVSETRFGKARPGEADQALPWHWEME
jgi:hypothetical protein